MTLPPLLPPNNKQGFRKPFRETVFIDSLGVEEYWFHKHAWKSLKAREMLAH